MRAIVYRNYGSPDVLRCEEVEKPAVGNGDVLIKVQAASVNPYDWHLMRGTPYLLRLIFGLRRPKSIRFGVDVAGTVEKVGGNVTEFKPGDDVFGTCKGAFAEYGMTSGQELAIKPENVTFAQAAAVPIAAFTALQGLRNHGKIQAGQTVLINGAAGGVGTFAVQIAKSFGAQVTGVCSTRNLEMVRSIGADQAINYTQEDFTGSAKRYDVLFDCIGNHPLMARIRVLKASGIYVAAGGSSDRWGVMIFVDLLKKLVVSLFVSQKLTGFIAKPNKEDLETLRELMAAGKMVPVIDRCYSLSEVPEAIRYLEQGHAQGKVAIANGF